MTDNDLIRLGKVIETARRSRGLSAREVAEAVGISPAYLRAIERGSNPKTQKPSRPTADALRRIAKEVGVEPGELLQLAAYPPILSGPQTLSEAPARRAVDDLVRIIQEAAKGLNKRSPFMYSRTAERLDKFAKEFRLMAQGTLRCKADDEPSLTRLAVNECQSQLRAVSYQDESWWLSEAGTRYLELHEELRGRPVPVEMTRIFIVDDDALMPLMPTLKRHQELDIETFVLSPKDVGPDFWLDFVIYDDALVRTAAIQEGSEGKTAQFSDDPSTLAFFIAHFNELVQIAKTNLSDVGRVLVRLSSTSHLK